MWLPMGTQHPLNLKTYRVREGTKPIYKSRPLFQVVEGTGNLLGLNFFNGSMAHLTTGNKYGNSIGDEALRLFRAKPLCEGLRQYYVHNPPYGNDRTLRGAQGGVAQARWPVLLCIGAQGHLLGCKDGTGVAATADNYISIIMVLV